MVGNAYMVGDPEQNVERGVLYLRKAAGKGHALAGFQIAAAYKTGFLPNDEAEELKWLKIAATLGHKDAREALAN